MSECDAIRRYLNFDPVERAPKYEVLEIRRFANYERRRILYRAEDGDTISAFLFLPKGNGPFAAVQVHHQHNGQRHLGKSEVAGIAGDPLQAFGRALAERGLVVLAADSVSFEDSRRGVSGIEAHENDWLQHFLEMGDRLTAGDTLMRKVLSDASSGLALLQAHRKVDRGRVGVLGHSYGGNTVLFQAALEPRVAFAVSSGALCSYRCKREKGIPLELALIVPGFAARWDLHDLLDCIAPRPLLVVSAEEDQYSLDAPQVISRARTSANISHFRDEGGHAMTAERFERIVRFVLSCSE